MKIIIRIIIGKKKFFFETQEAWLDTQIVEKLLIGIPCQSITSPDHFQPLKK